MAKQLKVVRVDRSSSFPVVEELEALAKINAEVLGADVTSEDEIIKVAQDADALMVVASQITRRVMEALPKCKVIVRYGIGYDNIDVEAATDNSILVVNIPDFCLEEVSSHAITLLLACAKKLVLLNNCLKQNSWAESQKAMAPMGSIYGQTLGLVGCGNIGRMTARKAQCFGLGVLGYDPYLDKALAKEYEITLVELSELLRESDYISVHAPLTKETRHLIGEKEFKQMKPTAYFINTARGPIVDEAALVTALREKYIAGAGLDVFEKEPVGSGNPLFKMDNVIVTPHSASYCDASYERLKRSVGQEVARVLSGHWPKNLVNKRVQPKVKLAE